MANFDKGLTGDYTFDDIRNKFEFYSLPKNQRPYVWTREKVLKLFECIDENEEGYYIGNILSQKDDSNSIIIIDGQQRIITILLFLSAIRNILKNIQTNNNKALLKEIRELADNINNYHLKNLPAKSTNQETKIKLHKDNLQQIINEIILNNNEYSAKDSLIDLQDNEKHLVNIYKYIFNQLNVHISGENKIDFKASKIEAKNYFNKLKKIYDKIIRVQFILIVCKEENDIYNMFEGLNATGQALNQIDLVKNVVMSYCKSSKHESQIKSLWCDLEMLFEETDYKLFEKFLRYLWISKYGYISGSQVFNSFKSILKDKKEDEIIEFTKELINSAKIYLGLRTEKSDNLIAISKKKINKEIISQINKFQHLNLDQIYGVLLSLVNKFIDDDKFTEKQFKQELNKLWIFTLRAKVIRVIPSKYERIFAQHCKYINDFNSEKFNSISNKFYKDLESLVSSSSEFINNFSEDIKYSEKNLLTKIILIDIFTKYDISTSQYIHDEITREHILDRDPKNWNLKKSDVKSYVDKIGNLTLLFKKDNGKLADATPQKKMDLYKNDIFKINKDIEKEYKKDFLYNPKKAIEKRGKELAEIANDIYKL